jgi:hypothetical protein
MASNCEANMLPNASGSDNKPPGDKIDNGSFVRPIDRAETTWLAHIYEHYTWRNIIVFETRPIQ